MARNQCVKDSAKNQVLFSVVVTSYTYEDSVLRQIRFCVYSRI